MNQINPNNINFKKLNGLIPAIIQDAQTQQVLMLGFMNEEALQKTIDTKKVWFYSRTRSRLWMKGEESGNILNLISISSDCDNDTLLIQAKPDGPTCHTNATSCFGEQKIDGAGLQPGSEILINPADGAGLYSAPEVLLNLFKLIQGRKSKMPKNSYTTSLFKDGVNKICEKIEEESLEVIQAAKKETKQRLAEESCDLIYHLLVLLVKKEIRLDEVFGELDKRRK